MNLKTKFCTFLLFWLCMNAHAQIQDYGYIRALNGITDQWHSIVLPDEVFSKVSPDLYDIRIFGITTDSDTIETPYLLQVSKGETSDNDIQFNIINTSNRDQEYYFTFEIPADESINQIKLNFRQENFDWNAKLEGSQDQQEWFTIVKDYRILSIKNEGTDFQFTKINFPDSRYRFFRLAIISEEKPDLASVTISQQKVAEGDFKTYPVNTFLTYFDMQTKQTEIDIDLPLHVPVSNIKIDIKDTFDYYRPVTIKYPIDSFRTEQGWKYNYKTLILGTLSSVGENEFSFKSTILQKLKIIIHNRDNQPLKIDVINVKGYIHKLISRHTEAADYFLAYGNSKAKTPQYDISHFTDKIPDAPVTLELGEEQKINKQESEISSPLFQNKIWLWAVMIIIILLLGWFSIRMIGNKE